MAWHDVHDPQGRLLFRYDPQRGLIAIKSKGVGTVLVDLEWYRQATPDVTQDAASEESPQ